MTSNALLTTMALATVIVSAPALARSAPETAGELGRVKPAMQVIPNSSQPDQAAYGWQYFSDPRAAHAVVISPSGEYFLSLRGRLRQITGPAGQLLERTRTRVVKDMR